MTTKNQSPSLAELEELDKQFYGLAAIIGSTIGKLEKKGMNADADAVTQRYRDLSEQYRQKVDFVWQDNHPPKPASVKKNEVLRISEQRNQAFSGFATEIRKKYSSIDSLPDIPFTAERREKSLGEVGRAAAKAFGKGRSENSLPGAESEEMQKIGRQFMESLKKYLGLPDGSTDSPAPSSPPRQRLHSR